MSSYLPRISRWRGRTWFRAIALVQAALITSSCGVRFGSDDDPSEDHDRSGATAIASAPPSAPSSTPVDEGQGAFSEQVNNAGAFVYGIDFELPDAIKGMKPQLKLSYSSQGDVGIAGVGWDLPVPMITINQADGFRPRTQTADLDRYPDLTPVERYSSQLGNIAVSRSGSAENYLFNPNNDIEILPIKDSTNVGTSRGGDIAAWQVRTKDGTTYRYGYEEQSSLWQDQPSPQERKVAWYLDQVTDTSGNTMHYYWAQYPRNDKDRQPVLRAIAYGQTAANPSLPAYVVKLNYQASPWTRTSYGLGTLTTLSSLLDDVCVYAPATVASTTTNGHQDWSVDGSTSAQYCYELDYNYSIPASGVPIGVSSGYTGRPLLLQVTKQGSDGTSSAPWKFSYTQQNKTWSSKYAQSVAAGGTDFVPPDLNMYLSQSTHDTTQMMGDLDGDGSVDFMRGDPTGSMTVFRGGGTNGAPTFTAQTWDHPLKYASAVAVDLVPTDDVHKDSSRSDCWFNFMFTGGWSGTGSGLGYASDLTSAPPDFYDTYEKANASNEDFPDQVPLGGFQFLSSSFYNPPPSINDGPFSTTYTFDQIETFGAYKDRKVEEYAFDHRSADCQDWLDKLPRRPGSGYCWNLSGQSRVGALGDDLECLDPKGSRWFTQNKSTESFSSELWRMGDQNGDMVADWVFAAPVIARTATNEYRNFKDGANDRYVAFGNGDGWDAPVPWHVPAKNADLPPGVDFVHGTGLLGTSVASSGSISNQKFGASVCLSPTGVSAHPLLGGLPSSPRAAVQMGESALSNAALGAVVGSRAAAQIETGLGAISAISKGQVVSVCLDLTATGLSSSIYLPIIGDLANINGTLEATANRSYQADVDINGDGRPDLVSARYDAGSTINTSSNWLFYRNNGHGFEKPALFQFVEPPKHPYGADLFSLSESINLRYHKKRYDVNPLGEEEYWGAIEQVADEVDLNGDGLKDVVTTKPSKVTSPVIYSTADVKWTVYFNLGDHFAAGVDWNFEGGFKAPGCSGIQVAPKLSELVYYEAPDASMRHSYLRSAMELRDVNKDGLVDFVYLDPYEPDALGICSYIPGAEPTAHSIADWISYADPQHLKAAIKVRLNTGTSFAPPIKWADSNAFPMSGALTDIYLDSGSQKLVHTYARGVTGTSDIDGDGVEELARLIDNADKSHPAFKLYPLTEPNPDRISQVTLPAGGSYKVTYAYHREPQADMVGGVWTVSHIEAHDIDATRTTSGTDLVADHAFTYEHGVFDHTVRKFLGFEKIYHTVTGGDGYTLSRYVPQRGFEGLPYCREVRRVANASSVVSSLADAHNAAWASGPPSGYIAPTVVGSASQAATVPGPKVEPDETNAALEAAPASESSGGSIPDTGASGSGATGSASDDAAEEAAEGTRVDDDHAHLYDGTTAHEFEPITSPVPTLSHAPLDSIVPGTTFDAASLGPGTGIVSVRPFLNSSCVGGGDVGGVHFTCDQTTALDNAGCGDSDDPGKLVDQEFHAWANRSAVAGVYTPRELETRHFRYDANGTNPRQTKVSRTFDAQGNVVTQIDHGDVAVTTDDQTRTVTYAKADARYIESLPCHEVVTDSASQVLAESWTDYDAGTGRSCAAPTKGLPTTMERSIDASSSVTETVHYTAAGVPDSTVDGRGITTTTSYHATYPWLVTGVDQLVNDVIAVGPTTTTLQSRTLHSGHTYHAIDDTVALSFGLPATDTDVSLAVTSYEWDGLRRPTKTIKPGDTSALPSELRTYQTATLPHSITIDERIDATRVQTRVELVDGFDRTYKTKLTAPTNTIGASWSITNEQVFDAEGRAIVLYQPHFEVEAIGAQGATNTTRDVLGRPTKIVGPNGGTTTIGYDREKITTTDPMGGVRYVEVDAHGYPAVEGDYADGNLYRSTSYTRRPDGKPTTIVGPGGDQWTFAYDRLGRQTQSVDPDVGTTKAIYDGNGNPIVWYDNRYVAGAGVTRIVTAATYDALDRPLKRTEYSNANVMGIVVTGTIIAKTDYFWDSNAATLAGSTITCPATSKPLGHLARVEHSQLVGGALVMASKKEQCFDARGRITRQNHTIDGRLYTYQFAYDGLDHVLTKTMPDADMVTTTFDRSGHATQVQNLANNLVTSASYDAAGDPLRRGIGVGAGAKVQQWCWDRSAGASNVLVIAATGTAALGVDCPTRMIDTHTVPAQLSHSLQYAVDLEGKPASRTERYLDPVTSLPITNVASYLHDKLDRLTSETFGTTTLFDQDERDNLTARGAVQQCYGAASCAGGAPVTGPHQINSTTTGDVFAYDLAGNVSTWARGGVTFNYAYDANNHQTSIMRGTTLVATILYDADGNRVSKQAGTTRTDYPGNGFRANDVTGAWRTESMYPGIGLKVATATGAAPYFTTSDGTMSTATVIDGAGAVVQYQGYAPYGALRATSSVGAYATDQLFNGKERDDELARPADSIYDFGAREYAATVGRWMSADSLAYGLGRYTFSHNSPVWLHDPDGHAPNTVAFNQLPTGPGVYRITNGNIVYVGMSDSLGGIRGRLLQAFQSQHPTARMILDMPGTVVTYWETHTGGDIPRWVETQVLHDEMAVPGADVYNVSHNPMNPEDVAILEDELGDWTGQVKTTGTVVPATGKWARMGVALPAGIVGVMSGYLVAHNAVDVYNETLNETGSRVEAGAAALDQLLMMYMPMIKIDPALLNPMPPTSQGA